MLLLVASGCASSGALRPDEPALPRPAVGLWELAPPGTRAALVVQDGSISLLERDLRAAAAGWLRADRDTWRWLAPLLARRPEELGLDLARGAAVFATEAGPVAFVLPVAHRDRFRAVGGGTRVGGGVDRFPGFSCEARQGRYLCAVSEAQLSHMGRSGARARDVRRWPDELRGEIEAWAAPGAIDLPSFLAVREAGAVRLAAHVAPGVFTIRAQLLGRFDVAVVPPTDLTWSVARVRPAGFLLSRLPALGPRGTGEAWTGEVVAYTLPGEPSRGVAKLAIEDGRAARALAPLLRDDGRLTPSALVIGWGDAAPAGPPAELTGIARKLLDSRWSFAAWGRGFHVRALGGLGLPPERWLLRHLVEVGTGLAVGDSGLDLIVHLRTIHSYPEALAAAVERALDRAAFADLRALAESHPGSDLAGDVAAGADMARTAFLSLGIPFQLARRRLPADYGVLP